MQKTLYSYVKEVPVKLTGRIMYKGKIHEKGSIVWLPVEYAKDLQEIGVCIIMGDVYG